MTWREALDQRVLRISVEGISHDVESVSVHENGADMANMECDGFLLWTRSSKELKPGTAIRMERPSLSFPFLRGTNAVFFTRLGWELKS